MFSYLATIYLEGMLCKQFLDLVIFVFGQYFETFIIPSTEILKN